MVPLLVTRMLVTRVLVTVLAAALAGCAAEPSSPGQVPSPGQVAASRSVTSSGPGAAASAGTSGEGPAGSPSESKTVSILGAGDILLHPPLWQQARRDGNGSPDFAPLLESVRPAVSRADLALCHLETPLAPAGGPYAGFPRFSVPPQVARAIAQTGFDGCSTASNHSLDQGFAGVKRTLDELDRVGLGHAGTFRTAGEARRTQIYRANGVPVAHLAYTSGFNGLTRPTGKSWVAGLIDPATIAADAAGARAAGAEIVVVSLHWGTEYAHQPDASQRDWARRVAAIRDVDVIFGHHAHVVQPVERRSGKWVVYGMGNQIARHAQPINANREGVMVMVTFRPAGQPHRWTSTIAEAFPTFVDLEPRLRLVDLDRALTDPATDASRRRSYRVTVDRVAGHLRTGATGGGLTVRGIDR